MANIHGTRPHFSKLWDRLTNLHSIFNLAFERTEVLIYSYHLAVIKIINTKGSYKLITRIGTGSAAVEIAKSDTWYGSVVSLTLKPA